MLSRGCTQSFWKIILVSSNRSIRIVAYVYRRLDVLYTVWTTSSFVTRLAAWPTFYRESHRCMFAANLSRWRDSSRSVDQSIHLRICRLLFSAALLHVSETQEKWKQSRNLFGLISGIFFTLQYTAMSSRPRSDVAQSVHGVTGIYTCFSTLKGRFCVFLNCILHWRLNSKLVSILG